MTDLYLVLAGLVGGFLAGLTGIGTGVVMLVVVPLVLGSYGITGDEVIPYTIANTLFATSWSALINTFTAGRKGYYLKESLMVGIPGVITGALMLELFVKKLQYSQIMYTVVVIVILSLIVYRTTKKLRTNFKTREMASAPVLIVAGIFGGLVSSLSGLGGGSVTIPTLNLAGRMNIKKSKNITYSMIFLLSAMLTLLNLFSEPVTIPDTAHYMGYIIFPIAVPLSIGALVSSPIGVRASERIHSRTITLIFISFIILVLLRKIQELYLLL